METRLLTTLSSEFEAQLLISLLENEDIPCFYMDDSNGTLYSGFALMQNRIYVPDNYYTRAQHILAHAFATEEE